MPNDTFTANLKWAALVISSAAAIATGWVALSEYVPETRLHAQEAYASTSAALIDHDKRLKTVERRIESIDRNSVRSLNLQLRGALRSIDTDLKAMPQAAAGRKNLEDQRDKTALDLRENQNLLDAAK